jgi:hypothetical protein
VTETEHGRRRNGPRLGMRVFLAGKKGPSVGVWEALSVTRMGGQQDLECIAGDRFVDRFASISSPYMFSRDLEQLALEGDYSTEKSMRERELIVIENIDDCCEILS